nr:glycosyltransferase family A protein [Qipengyuania qiaonensis]
MDKVLVSVVVPAYNAAATLCDTLRSVCAQTHRNLEIIVVDDGSRDDTMAIGQAEARRDERIKIVSQVNGGVAAARNHGISLASADYIAPIDADDLWHPTKIERQLRAMLSGAPQIGLVYCWSAIIDEHNRITDRAHGTSHDGDVLRSLACGNFVGNGSSALMRRDLVIEAGGFDESLRTRKAQGCEDWQLYLDLAERSLFAVIPDFLVGYRYTQQAMSGDVSQMVRSYMLVSEALEGKHPSLREEIAWGLHEYLEWMIYREIRQGNWQNCQTLARVRDRKVPNWRRLVRKGRLTARYVRRRLSVAEVTTYGAYLAELEPLGSE